MQKKLFNKKMEDIINDLKIENYNYDKTFLKVIVSGVDKILTYWNITPEFDNELKKKYGEDFLQKTKTILVLKNYSGVEDTIELKEYTNNYYIKYKYSNAIYTVELQKVGIDDDKDYGYKLVSNTIQTPLIKVGLNKYKQEDIKFKNIKTGEKIEAPKIDKTIIEELYNNKIMPSWEAYKKENSYRE